MAVTSMVLMMFAMTWVEVASVSAATEIATPSTVIAPVLATAVATMGPRSMTLLLVLVPGT